MSDKVDIQKSARLTVEADRLTKNILDKYGYDVYIDNSDKKPHRVCNKSRQRFERRASRLDEIIAAQASGKAKIYVGRCSKNTPLGRQECLATPGGSIIYFDIAELENH